MKNLTEIAYFTDDVAAMAGFYQEFLGTPPVAQSEGMAIFMIGETKIFIHANYTPGEDDLPPENHIAYSVDDLELACQALVDKGLVLEVAPKSYYWGISAYLRDPDGHLIELIQREQER